MTSQLELKNPQKWAPNSDAQLALTRFREFLKYPKQNPVTDALHVSLSGERPFTIGGDTQDLSSIDNVFPMNYNKLLKETSGTFVIRYSLFVEMLCRISSIAIILYPEGLKRLEDYLIVEKSIKTEEILELSTLATSFKTTVNLSLYVPSAFQGAGSLTPCVEISFDRQRMSISDNRFGARWGCHNFITVSFSNNHINLHDILSGDTASNMSLEDFQLECQKSWYAAFTTDAQFSSELSKQERQRVVKATQDFVQKNIGGEIRFLSRTWNLLSCNIAGVQTRRYVYTLDPLTIMDWALNLKDSSSAKQIFDEKARMKIFLRMGLLNTTCVKVIDKKLMNSSCEVLFCDDVCPPHDKTVALNDGCGRISLRLAKRIVKNYETNYPYLLDALDKFTLHSTRERLDADFLLSSCNHVICPSGWLTPDLPDPKSLYEILCKSHTEVPSAFQIRYGGCKGMVVVDPSLTGFQLVIYNSMKKFFIRSNDSILGALYVAGMSMGREQRVTLSSELFTMFEGNCRSDCQESLVQYLKEFIIHNREDCQGKSLSDVLQNEQVGVDLMKRRYDASNRNFLKSQTFLSYLFRLNTPLPLSANVFGVACFDRYLRSNEVFLQVLMEDGYKVVTGPVLIAKPPCLKCSDLVLFMAVDKAKLRHLRDVVVFSTCSDVLVTSQVSNADLDGDHFSILWDPRLLNLLNCAKAREDIVTVPVYSQPHDTIKLTIDKFRPSPLPQFECHHLQALEALRQPINSVEFCSLHLLLELRRRVLDVKSWDWPQDSLLKELADAIKRTLEAPKHGSWVRWSELRHLPSSIHPFPHHYKRSSGLTSRHSISLFGKLYDALLHACCNSPIQATTSLADELSFWTMCFKHAIGRGIADLLVMNSLIGAPEAVLQSISKGESVLPNTFIKALAFFQVAPASGDICDRQWRHSLGIVSAYRISPLQALADGLEEDDRALLSQLRAAITSPQFLSNSGIPLYPRFWKFIIDVAGAPERFHKELQTYCKFKYELLVNSNPMGHACMFKKKISALRNYAASLGLEAKNFQAISSPFSNSPLPQLEQSVFKLEAGDELFQFKDWSGTLEGFHGKGGTPVCIRTDFYVYVAYSTKDEDEIPLFDERMKFFLEMWREHSYVGRWHPIDFKFPTDWELDDKYVAIWKLKPSRTEDDYTLHILHNLERWCATPQQVPEITFIL